jgi:hypothetical protein
VVSSTPQESAKTRGLADGRDRKLDALAERIKKVRGPQETLAEFIAVDREPKSPKSGPAH